MRRQSHLFAGTALAALVTAQGAAAELTAEQVWQELQTFATQSGQMLEGTPESRGEALVIDPARLRMQDETTEATARIEELRLTEREDGTVAISVAPRYPMTVASQPPEGPPVEMAFTLGQPDLEIVASGVPGNVAYAIDAPRIAVALERMTRGGERVDTDFSAQILEVDGTYAIDTGEPSRLEIDLAAQEVETSGQIVPPEDAGTVDFSLNLDDVEATSTSRLPQTAESADLAAMLEAGYSSEATLSYGAGRYKTKTRDADGDERLVNATVESGSADIEVDGETLAYANTNTGVAATLEGWGLPVGDAEVRVAESQLDLEMPVAPTDEAQSFEMLLRLAGVALGEELWSALDPTGALPHTPAELTLDLSGAGRWAVNLFDPSAGAGDGAPGELDSLEIESLALSAAGAELTGEGEFAFSDDTAGFAGLPAASGTAEFRLAGFDALLDDLVEMGAITRERATGVRMMIGLVAEEGEEDGTLVSEIEVEEDGTIRANGQRLR